MKAIFKILALHAIRSRALVFLVLSSAFFQFLFAKIIGETTLHLSFNVQGNAQKIDPGDLLFGALILTYPLLFSLSTIYGAWIVPYLHRGPRGTLMYCTPAPRSGFVTAHCLILFFLVLLQGVLSVISNSFIASADKSHLLGLFLGTLYLSLPSMVVGIFSAFLSLSLGPLASFLIGPVVLFALAGYQALNQESLVSKFLPPFSSLFTEVKGVYEGGLPEPFFLVLWVAWVAIAYGLLLWRISSPASLKSEET